MIDINELRRKLGSDDLIDRVDIHANVKPVLTELLNRLEAAERNLSCCRAEREEAAALFLSVKNRLTGERDALRTELADLRSSMTFRTSLIGRIEAERDALQAKVEAMERQEPVFWWRPCSDGAYEGPIHNSSIERVRKQSGAWSPLYLAPGAQPAPSALAEAIIADMQAQHDSELITENDSGEALIRLDGAIAAVEDNFALAQPTPSAPAVDALAQFIREIDGAHRLGAGVLAERIVAWLAAAPEAKPCP